MHVFACGPIYANHECIHAYINARAYTHIHEGIDTCILVCVPPSAYLVYTGISNSVTGQFVADNSSQDNSSHVNLSQDNLSRTTHRGQFVADNSSQNIFLYL